MTDTTCQTCKRPTHNALCTTCTTELRAMLQGLAAGTNANGKPTPGWLEHLADAAIGRTRMGDGGRRTRTEPEGLKGDSDAIQDNPDILRKRFLALGGINSRASDLYARILTMLTDWALALQPTLNHPERFTAGTLALWIAQQHMDSTARHPRAGEWHSEARIAISDIEHLINRPQPPRFCGPCPTQLEQSHDSDCTVRHPHACSTALMAKRDAVEVRCPTCKQTHNVDQLLQHLLADVDHWRFTASEITMIMRTLDEPLVDRTFRHWRKVGKVRPRGFRRPDGRMVLTRHTDDDEPVYRLSDVRKLRNQREAATA